MKRIVALVMCIIALYAQNVLAQNQNISGGIVFEGEPYLAVDPVNPLHMVVAWMGYVPGVHTSIKVKTTFDGGNTWSTAAALAHQSPNFKSADVSLAFGHTGTVYVCYVDYRQSPDSGGVYIAKSTDGGLSWGSGSLVISCFADGSKDPIDRPWLAITRGTGSAPDSLCVTTKPPSWIGVPNRPYFTKSVDNGNTWSSWRYIDSTGYKVGNLIQAPMAAPAVDSAGKFHCVYPAYLASESVYPRYIMATNGPANSFSYDVVYNVTTGGPIDTLAKAGGRLICDPTKNKHLAFLSLQNLHGDLDAYCTETFDGGTTWNTPLRINDDAVGNGKMQDLVWGNFDEHGNMVVAWRDRRNAPGTGYQQESEIWGAMKWKDSANVSANFRLSDAIVAYDSLYLSGSGNDFMNVVMAHDTLSAVWGDVRTGALNIWFSRKAMYSGASTGIRNLVSEHIPVVKVYPNPVTTFVNIDGEDLGEYTITDMTGRQVRHQKIAQEKNRIDFSSLRAGQYVVTVRTLYGVVSERIVK